MEDSFTILERYINEKKPGYIIKKVNADRLCVIRSLFAIMKTLPLKKLLLS